MKAFGLIRRMQEDSFSKLRTDALAITIWHFQVSATIWQRLVRIHKPSPKARKARDIHTSWRCDTRLLMLLLARCWCRGRCLWFGRLCCIKTIARRHRPSERQTHRLCVPAHGRWYGRCRFRRLHAYFEWKCVGLGCTPTFLNRWQTSRKSCVWSAMDSQRTDGTRIGWMAGSDVMS